MYKFLLALLPLSALANPCQQMVQTRFSEESLAASPAQLRVQQLSNGISYWSQMVTDPEIGFVVLEALTEISDDGDACALLSSAKSWLVGSEIEPSTIDPSDACAQAASSYLGLTMLSPNLMHQLPGSYELWVSGQNNSAVSVFTRRAPNSCAVIASTLKN